MAHTQYACRRRNTGTLRIAEPLVVVFTQVLVVDYIPVIDVYFVLNHEIWNNYSEDEDFVRLLNKYKR